MTMIAIAVIAVAIIASFTWTLHRSMDMRHRIELAKAESREREAERINELARVERQHALEEARVEQRARQNEWEYEARQSMLAAQALADLQNRDPVLMPELRHRISVGIARQLERRGSLTEDPEDT